jgi:predicted HAD superfamily Cof-like phosphohydrolase
MTYLERELKQSLFEDVGDFHEKFGLPCYRQGTMPHFPPVDVIQFRFRFMEEELTEFAEACTEDNLAKAADALVDLVYVALGTAHLMGVPFDQCWAEVQRANMTKVRASGADDPLSKRKHSLDVVKPQGWTPPDIEGVLRQEGWDG